MTSQRLEEIKMVLKGVGPEATGEYTGELLAELVRLRAAAIRYSEMIMELEADRGEGSSRGGAAVAYEKARRGHRSRQFEILEM